MIGRSIYVVQSQIISLGRLPFLNKKVLRSHFAPMFSKTCYLSMRDSILHSRQYRIEDYEPPLLPSKPFIKNLGQIYFNVSSVRLAKTEGQAWHNFMPDGDDGYILMDALADDDAYREIVSDPKKASIQDPECFGYDPRLEDQRMNLLYFELRHPLFFRGALGSRTLSDGRLHLHFYPSGYLAINLCFSMKNESLESIKSLQIALSETRPWSHDNKWQWQSKFGTTSLPELTSKIKELVFRSIFKEDNITSVWEGNWHFMVKIVTGLDAQQFASTLFPQGYSNIPLGQKHERNRPLMNEILYSSKKGMICCVSAHRSKKSATRLFRKIFSVYEFVLLKNQIYADYAEFLRPEIAELKKYRLSVRHKIMEDDILKMSVYNNQIPAYLMQLDAHIRSISANYRRIYSFISKSLGFGERRIQVYKFVKEWEEEVSKWEPPLGLIWKKIISPLRSLLS